MAPADRSPLVSVACVQLIGARSGTATAIVRRHAERAGGVEATASERGIVVTFATPAAALACVVDAGRAIAELARSRPMAAARLRAGVHCGDAAGPVGDVARGIAAAAEAGEVLITAAVRDACRADAGEPRLVRGRGLADIVAYPVVAARGPAPTASS
jgi:class 3 adenylate cyclase